MKHLPLHLFLLVLTFLLVPEKGFSQVVINEIQSGNSSSIKDDFGATSDWIELYNTGINEFDLSGYYLTDDATDSVKWKIPTGTKIAGNSYLIFWADGKNAAMHTNFKLSSTGEFMGLYNTLAAKVDSTSFPNMSTNLSYGRITDASTTFCVFTKATPGKSNTVSTMLGEAGITEYSIPGGFYAGVQTVSLSTSFPNGVIHYTTDGSEPTEKSPIFTNPITITKITKETQRIGVKEYRYPVGLVSNTKYSGQRDFATVVKAKVYCPNYLPGKTIGATYFIDMRKPTLPVISLSTDSYHLFSDTAGIYVQGTNGKPETIDGQVIKANWYNGWEKPAYFEYYDEQGVLQVKKKIGISIMGDVSKNSDQKAFHIETKSAYESGNLNYKFFKDSKISSFSAVSLRASGNDWKDGNMCRDAIIQNIVKDKMNIDYQEYQPAVLYINGEYFGLQNVRERLRSEYCEEHYKNVDAANVDFIKLDWEGYVPAFVAKTGDLMMFNEMMSFFNNNDLSVDANYKTVVDKYIDLDAFINYYIAEIYLSNEDWPYNNLRIWRPRTATGKFRWILYDTDFGYGLMGRSKNTDDLYRNIDGNEWQGFTSFTVFFRKLVANTSFKNEFIQRLSYHLNTTYSPDRLTAIATKIENLVKDERDNYSDKEWARTPSKESSVASMIEWGTARPDIVRNQIKTNKKLANGQGWSTLTAQANDTTQGYIRLCTQKLETKYAGLHFNNIPIRLQAFPLAGYKFVRWEDETGKTLSTQSELTLSITANTSAIAVFNISTSLSNPSGIADTQIAITASPNPSDGVFNLSVDVLKNDLYTIRIFNTNGQALFNTQTEIVKNHTSKIDFTENAKGVYIVEVSSKNVAQSAKVIIK